MIVDSVIEFPVSVSYLFLPQPSQKSMSSSRHTRGSSTAVMELQSVGILPEPTPAHHPKKSSAQFTRVLGDNDVRTTFSQDEDRNESLPSPTTASQEVVERWNSSRMNMARTFAAFWGFVVMGMNDATYGVSTWRWVIAIYKRTKLIACRPLFPT